MMEQNSSHSPASGEATASNTHSHGPTMFRGSQSLMLSIARVLDSFNEGSSTVFQAFLESLTQELNASCAFLYQSTRAAKTGAFASLEKVASWMRGGAQVTPSLPERLTETQVRRFQTEPSQHGVVLLWEPSQLQVHVPERRQLRSPPRLKGLLAFRNSAGGPLELEEETRLAVALLTEAILRSERRYREATRDSLTDLFSRWQLDSLLQHEIRHSRSSSQPLSLLMIDLDQFKRFNDQWGQKIGDSILFKFGHLLLEVLRKTDLCVRYGGDRFAVILPATPLPGARIASQKIKKACEELSVPEGSSPLTISVGFAELGSHTTTVEDLIARADQALFRAKCRGGNQAVSFAPDEVPANANRLDELAGLFSSDASRAYRNLSLLLRVNRTLAQVESIEELLALVLDAALDVTGADRGYLILWEKAFPFEPNATRTSSPALPVAPPVAGHTLARGRGGQSLVWKEEYISRLPLQVLHQGQPINTGSGLEPGISEEDGSLLGCPLLAAQSFLGALFVESEPGRGLFEEADYEFFQALAGHAAVSIYQASLVEKLEGALEELQGLERLKSDFLSLASHELKTPLTVLTGYLDLMLRDQRHPLPMESQKSLKIMQEQTRRLVMVTQDLLTLSRVGVGRLPVRVTRFELRQLIRDVLEEIQPFATARGFELSNTPQGEPVYLDAERDAIRTVLQNLLQNAIRFTPDGGSVEIRLRVLERPERVRVEVQDNGIGIPPQDQARIFERFQVLERVENHFSGSYDFRSGGMGIGLSIARGILESHGGTLDVQSEVNSGSIFWFELPLNGEGSLHAQSVASQEPSEDGWGRFG